jgi:diguanylate cyclase (GGDEF)-like protein
VIVGLAGAIGLARYSAAPLPNQLAFSAIAAMIAGMLGYLASYREGRHLAHAAGPAAGAEPTECTSLPTEETVGAIVSDFLEWIDSEPAREDRAEQETASWAAFDQFVRQTLRERLGAARVRLYALSADGQQLKPLTRDPGPSTEWPAATTGLIGHVIASGNAFVAGHPEQGERIAELASDDAQSWGWLLPLRMHDRTCALVAVGRIRSAAAALAGITMADATRGLLQLFWTYVDSQQALRRSRRTDNQSGMLNRTELLKQLQQATRQSARDGEPIMVLTLAIEGMRRLDDTGHWSQRDALIERLGNVLRNKVRSDDLLGRFTDDRFVVVLRRLDSALGTLIAEKLMETVRTNVLDVHEDANQGPDSMPSDGLSLRGGLAGSGLADAQAEALLERALGLLDYARSQRIDLATDLMDGLPAELARGNGTAGRAVRPPPTAAPTPAKASEPDAKTQPAAAVQPGGQSA